MRQNPSWALGSLFFLFFALLNKLWLLVYRSGTTTTTANSHHQHQDAPRPSLDRSNRHRSYRSSSRQWQGLETGHISSPTYVFIFIFLPFSTNYHLYKMCTGTDNDEPPALSTSKIGSICVCPFVEKDFNPTVDEIYSTTVIFSTYLSVIVEASWKPAIAVLQLGDQIEVFIIQHSTTTMAAD